MQPDGGVRVIVFALEPGIGGADLDTEFFVQLAPERRERRLARLDLAARKLPVARVDLAGRTLAEQEAAVRPGDDRGDDFNS